MKVIVQGFVSGQKRYEEEADLGAGPLQGGGIGAEPIADAMVRIRASYDKDFPFDPFDLPENAADGQLGWPDLTYHFKSEFE